MVVSFASWKEIKKIWRVGGNSGWKNCRRGGVLHWGLLAKLCGCNSILVKYDARTKFFLLNGDFPHVVPANPLGWEQLNLSHLFQDSLHHNHEKSRFCNLFSRFMWKIVSTTTDDIKFEWINISVCTSCKLNEFNNLIRMFIPKSLGRRAASNSQVCRCWGEKRKRPFSKWVLHTN